MIERDYEELILHIIEELSNIQANDIIQQIKELESLKILDQEKPRKRKKLEEDISDSVTRQMTYKEMFNATLEILEKYLVTVPSMVNNLKNLLGKQSNSILWSIEGNKKFVQMGKETSLKSIDIIKVEDIGEIKMVLEKLKAC